MRVEVNLWIIWYRPHPPLLAAHLPNPMLGALKLVPAEPPSSGRSSARMSGCGTPHLFLWRL